VCVPRGGGTPRRGASEAGLGPLRMFMAPSAPARSSAACGPLNVRRETPEIESCDVVLGVWSETYQSGGCRGLLVAGLTWEVVSACQTGPLAAAQAGCIAHCSRVCRFSSPPSPALGVCVPNALLPAEPPPCSPLGCAARSTPAARPPAP
jgi:hypothetical protein